MTRTYLLSCFRSSFFFFFFFFQAEDGIRDLYVTGVQTCALPIYQGEADHQRCAENSQRNPQRTASTAAALMIGLALVALVATLAAGTIKPFRSEERRVGKEGRCRGAPEHEKKKEEKRWGERVLEK